MSTTTSPATTALKREGAAGPVISVRRVWFTMVFIPTKGWTRVGKAYGSREAATGWLGFVGKAWHGLRTRVAQCTLRWEDGVMDERSRRVLSEKFNMDPPETTSDAGNPAQGAPGRTQS